MPTHDFRCRDCDGAFEEWVRKHEDLPPCPACASADVERMLSMPTIHSSSTRASSMRAARRRDDRQQNENMHTRLEYEANHD